MNDLIPITSGNALAVKTTSSLVARGLGRLGELTQKDLDFEMGHNHWEGINGYEQSDSLAIEYFKKSAAKNNYEAMYNLCIILTSLTNCECTKKSRRGFNYKGFEATCDSTQFKICQRHDDNCYEWLYKAALGNYPPAQILMPGYRCYCDDTSECSEISCWLDKFGWLEKAAEQNYPPAFLRLADKYPENETHYFEKLEQLDTTHPEYSRTIFELAARHIQIATYKGRKDTVRVNKGLALYMKVAKLGYSSAQLALAEHFSENKICASNTAEAFFWCNKASESGSRDAHFLLATFYENGVGTDISFSKAIEYFQKLVDQSHPRYYKAKIALEKINELNHQLLHKNI